ncbi:hypothetical protein BDA99DRAFT_522239 [Phascolomyces articulosus]|uniref:AMP-dependent synthetase/ligase domain-containing protein n=1 Tax=Phascolomyces articulosus TaxID=60185 RepID=A0AAD5JRE3_9FUNG|nr:hypothetical protein BDA99DRAFT_522239 [Phascolomyces articulosus]
MSSNHCEQKDAAIVPTYTDYDSIIHAFQIMAARHKDKPFIHYPSLPNNTSKFKTLTYGQFDIITTYLAKKEWGPTLIPSVDPHTQCVGAIGHESSIQSLLALFTVWKLGLAYFPVVIGCEELNAKRLLKRNNAAYVIASTVYFKTHVDSSLVSDTTTLDLDKMTKVPMKHWKPYDIDQILAVATAYNEKEEEKQIFVSNKVDLDSIALITVTGGSTMGLSKTVSCTHRAMLFSLIDLSLNHEDQLNDGPMVKKSSDVWVSYWTVDRNGFIYLFLWSMMVGASTLVFHHDPYVTPHDFFQVSKLYNPKWTFLIPRVLDLFVEYLQENSSDNEITSSANRVLQDFEGCMTASAPLRSSTAEFLTSRGLKLASGYGATEFGTLCTTHESMLGENIFKFSSLALPYLTFEPFDEGIYHLIIRHDYPGLGVDIGNRPNGDYETYDLWADNHEQKPGTWTLIGRINDVLTMENGKKIYPTRTELDIRCNDEIIHHCVVVVGDHQKCPAVLIQLKYEKAIHYSPTEMITKVYKAVRRANQRVPKHSVIDVPHMIYILPLDKKLPLASKGTVFRPGVISEFHHEINQLYYDSKNKIDDEVPDFTTVDELSVKNSKD